MEITLNPFPFSKSVMKKFFPGGPLGLVLDCLGLGKCGAHICLPSLPNRGFFVSITSLINSTGLVKVPLEVKET